MDTMITKWDLGKFERTHHPHPTWFHVLSGFYHQKHIPDPIFRNFHHISLYIKWFRPQFCHTLSGLVPELPILSNFDDVLEGRPKKRENAALWNRLPWECENGKWGNNSGFQFFFWNWVNFRKYCPFSASFDHLVQIIQKHPPT